MAELSAKERYDNADLDAFSAYSDACSQHEEHVHQYNTCLKEYERICDTHAEILQEISEKAKTCNEAYQSIDSDINVVVIGIMNHGKSTMLNALLNDTDDSLFKVADRRETREIQCEERDGICWTDTPGFDADEADDNKALAGIKQLKIGLFVHKASTGELHANEVEVLHKISNTYEKTFMDNTCIVLNKDINDDEELKMVREKISEQLEDLLGESLNIFPCNPKSYQKGLRENKKILAGKSGITELRDWIKGRYEYLGKTKGIRIDQTLRIHEPEIRQKCKKAIAKLEVGIQDIEEQIRLAVECSDKLHNAIKEIERNKDKMRGLRKEVISDEKVGGGLLGGGGGAAVGAAIGSIVPFFGTLTGAAIGAALGSTAGAASSDFDEEHNSNMEMHNDHINELNEKKNDVAESIQDFRRWQDELQGFLQKMQECHESWE